MKPKTKIILISSLFALATTGAFVFAQSVQAASCGGNTEKYFPSSQISLATGQLVVTTSQNNLGFTEGCTYRFQSGGVSVSIRKDDSAKRAYDSFNANYKNQPQLGIGDAAAYLGGNLGGVAIKDVFTFRASDACCGFNLSQSQVESLLRYAVDQVSPAELPKPPTIHTITPETVSAGMKTGFDKQTGTVLYADAEIKNFKIEGTNLQGAKLSVPKDLYGRPLARFVSLQTSPDGTSVTGWMYVSMGAPAGRQKITVTNSADLSAAGEINITITGTQYLKRKFTRTRVEFRGDWPQIAPDDEVLEIEKGVERGLAAINKPTYNNLGINIKIFAKDYWQTQNYCGGSTSKGCSYGTSAAIYISAGFGATSSDKTESTYLASTILHESAHKLDNCYGGVYFAGLVRCLRRIDTKFSKEWKAATGDRAVCKYLPLTANFSWNDSSQRIARCGYARSYGASSQAEDIATMTEIYYFYPEILKTGDGPKDARYKQKIDILKKYGFL